MSLRAVDLAPEWRPIEAGQTLTPPLVSVIINNFNYGRYLEACLASIAAQTYPHVECIIADDASSDDSAEIVRSWIDRNAPEKRFELVVRDRNGGQMAAVRSGLAQARGAFVAFVDADDLLLPDFLAAHVSAHLELPAVAMTACGFHLIDGEARLIGIKDTLANRAGEPLYVPPQLIWHSPWWWSAMSGAVFRRAAVELMITENEPGFVAGADNYLCQAANLLGGSMLLPGHHAAYRHHGQNNYGYLDIFGQAKRRPPRRKRRRNDTPTEIRRHLVKNRSRLLEAVSESQYWRMLIATTPPRAAWVWYRGHDSDGASWKSTERRRLLLKTIRAALLNARRAPVLTLEGRVVDLKNAPR